MTPAIEKHTYPDSWYAASATPLPAQPVLQGRIDADVCILGAGYTGLSAALELAEAGYRVVVLEAERIGWGASGRNGGQVVPLFRYEPDEILTRFGADVGGGVLDLVQHSADEVFDLAREHRLDCDALRAGWIQAAHGSGGAAIVRKRQAQWASRGAPVRMLESGELAAITGSSYYREGWVLEHAGTVNPLAYARGLASAAVRAGATIYIQSPATAIERRGDRWALRCPQGEVLARTVVLATNGYTTQLWPGLARSIVPLYSMQVASEPLAPALQAAVLPHRHAVADTRRLVWYFRRDRDARFVLGARGPFRARPTAADGAVLVDAARRLYPALRDVAFPFVWAGRVAVTADHIPHLHRLAPGVLAALGYNGRGVAMASAMGRVIAAACNDELQVRPRFPVTDLRTIPFHAFHRLGVRVVVAYFRLVDRFN